MSADVLREAAALMRSRAENAAIMAPSPWWSGGEWAHYYLPVDEGHDSEVHGWPCVGYGSTGADVVGHSVRRELSDHIASWHPAVALAVADWLDDAAIDLTEIYDSPWEPNPLALAVATAYLGSES